MTIENIDNHSTIEKLKMDCTSLENRNKNLENDIFKLTSTNNENNKKIIELQNQIVRNSFIIIIHLKNLKYFTVGI